MAPITFSRWTLRSQDPEFNGLQEEKSASIDPDDLANDEVLVELKAGSLNYRDLVVCQGGHPLFPNRPGLIPGYDSAGIINHLGHASPSSRFSVGDRVLIHMTPSLPSSDLPTMPNIASGIGATLENQGTLTKYGVFKKSALVKMPAHLSFSEGAVLGCAWLTAWNALMGIKGRECKAGDRVLMQGTGGVSVAGLQIAHALGAHIVATTSSPHKSPLLLRHGATHVLNYTTDPSWGHTARSHTPSSRGFDFILDIGGNSTLPHSLAAIKTDGIIALVGTMDNKKPGEEVGVPMLSALAKTCIVRGCLLGSKEMFWEMGEWMEREGVRPVLDSGDEGVVFGLGQVREAFRRVKRGGHFGKVEVRYGW